MMSCSIKETTTSGNTFDIFTFGADNTNKVFIGELSWRCLSIDLVTFGQSHASGIPVFLFFVLS